MQDLDSQLEDSNQGESMWEDKMELCYQQDEPKREAETNDTTDVSDAPDCNVALNCHVASGGNVGVNSNTAETNEPQNGNSESTCLTPLASAPTVDCAINNEVAETANLESKGGNQYTAENITSSYMHRVNLTSTMGIDSNNLNHKPVAVNYGNKPVAVNYGNCLEHRLNRDQDHKMSEDGLNLTSRERIACGSGNRAMPVFTSIPIMQRQEDTANSGAAGQNICAIISKIDQLDSGIKAIKRDILQHMECKLNELKSSVVNIIENLGPGMSYAGVTKNTASVQMVERPSSLENSQNLSVSSYIDEGYGDQSEVNVQRASSQTQLKTLFVPDTRDNERQPITISASCFVPVRVTNRENERQPSTTPTPRPVPVRVTNRNSPVHSTRSTFNTEFQGSQAETSSARQKRTLIIGDSILKGVNSRGLKKGVKICTRSGATINDLWDESSVYDMKSFGQIIICIGGNDCSSRLNIKTFEEKYDQLITFIKSANGDYAIYLSKALPRGDTNVGKFNRSIQRVAVH